MRNAARGRLGTADPSAERSAVFLAMGRDLANGVIGLNPVTGELQIEWDVAANLPLYEAERRLINDVAVKMGGHPALNPLWQLLQIPVSVHNLGGCLMADAPAGGVTDATGQVHGYSGLYVLDGAILPSATGVNPSHTIAAVAERNIEAAIRRIMGNDSWRAPEAASAQPLVDSLTSITIPPGGTVPTNTQSLGIAFTETMKGYVAKGWKPPDDYLGAEGAGQAADSRMDFTLTITLPDLDAFLVSADHAGIAKGVVHVNGFTPPRRGAGRGRGFQPFRLGRRGRPAPDALCADIRWNRWSKILARRMEGCARSRQLRRLGVNQHTLHADTTGTGSERARGRHRYNQDHDFGFHAPVNDLYRYRY